MVSVPPRRTKSSRKNPESLQRSVSKSTRRAKSRSKSAESRSPNPNPTSSVVASVNPGGTKKKKQRVEDQKWYHGIRTEDDVIPLLRCQGDYILRATESEGGRFEFHLMIKVDKDVDDQKICMIGGNYALEKVLQAGGNIASFGTVVELVKYYRRHRLPNGIRCSRGIYRPHWLVQHNAVHYEQKDKLGSGNFSDVFRGSCITEAAEVQVAIKICHQSTTDVDSKEAHEARIAMLEEAKMMARYKHQHIIKFIGIACERPPMMLLLELCVGGALDKHLQLNGSKMTNYEKCAYMVEAASGLKYLHSKELVHRDIASRNCLISSEGFIKIADFGLSTMLNNRLIANEVPASVPFRWMAPECLQKVPEFSFKSDVWSYGCLVFEIFHNGKKPFADEEDFKVIRKAVRKAEMEPLPESAPRQVKELLKDIWTIERVDRPEFGEICRRGNSLIAAEIAVLPPDWIVNQLEGVKRTKLPLEKEEKQQNSKSHSSSNKTNKKQKMETSRELFSKEKTNLSEKVKKDRTVKTVDATKTVDNEVDKKDDIKKEKTLRTATITKNDHEKNEKKEAV